MNRPPFLAAAILRWICTSAQAAEIEGDLLEIFARTKYRSGAFRARLRFWRELASVFLWRTVGRRGGPNPGPSNRRQPSSPRKASMFSDFIYDVRFGVRTLMKAPGFAAIAVLILSLGIGANTTMFTMMNSIFLQDPPAVDAPERLVAFTRLRQSGTGSSLGYPDYDYYRRNNTTFEGILAYFSSGTTVAAGTGDDVAQANAWIVSGNYFDVLGAQPALGRGFAPEESVTPGTHPVAVISDGFWARFFGSDPNVAGRTLTLNGRPFTVVGVAQRDFRGINPVEIPPDIFVPIMMQGALIPGAEKWLVRRDGMVNTWLRLVGRLDEGVSIETAQTQVTALKRRWEEEFAGWIESAEVTPFELLLTRDYRFTPAQSGRLRQLFTFLTIVVGAVLLIASANIAILLLARASARYREIGVRSALGAGRIRVLRQLLAESLLLGALGGLGGFAIAYWGAGVAASLLPYSFAISFTPDASVLLYTVGVSMAVAILFGLAPGWQLSRADISAFLQREASARTRSGFRNTLVVGQIAVSIILVAGAGLFVRSLLTAQAVNLGFDPDNKLLLTVELSNHGYDDEQGRLFVANTLERLRGLPGVVHATTITMTPFRGKWGSTFQAPGTAYAEEGFDSGFNSVGTGYLEAMRIPIVVGRAFDERDGPGSPKAVIVNETVARQVWGDEDPIGKTFNRSDEKWTVVGVAANATYYDVGEDPQTQVYISQDQNYDSHVTFMMHTASNPLTMAHPAEDVVRTMDPNLAIFAVRSMRSVADRELGSYRVTAILVSIFGALALIMASVGLYGVQSYLVAQRTREIGIRMALGALDRQVAATILGRGALLTILGIVVGVAAALGLATFVEGMLFGVSTHDPLTFTFVPLALLAVSLAASLLPAFRASRVDPMVALREE